MATFVINALGATMGGALRHLTSFLPALANTKTPHSFRILVRESLRHKLPPDVAEGAHLNFVEDARVAGAARRLAFDNITLNWDVFRTADAVVSLTNFGPIIPARRHILFQRNSIYFSDAVRQRAHGQQKAQLVLRDALATLQMQAAHTIVTPSHAMKDLILSAHPTLRRKRFFTLYHAIDPERFAPNSDTSNTSPRDDRDAFIFLYPSHLAIHKGLDILLPAIDIVARTAGRRFVVQIPADEAELADTERRLGRTLRSSMVNAHLALLGRQPQAQMVALYHAADAMVYPSLAESFGFSMVEAMSAGLAIAASDTAINREMCTDAATYYDATSPQACATAMLDLMRDAELRTRLAARGRARMQNFDWGWTRYVREFVTLCEQSLSPYGQPEKPAASCDDRRKGVANALARP